MVLVPRSSLVSKRCSPSWNSIDRFVPTQAMATRIEVAQRAARLDRRADPVLGLYADQQWRDGGKARQDDEGTRQDGRHLLFGSERGTVRTRHRKYRSSSRGQQQSLRCDSCLVRNYVIVYLFGSCNAMQGLRPDYVLVFNLKDDDKSKSKASVAQAKADEYDKLVGLLSDAVSLLVAALQSYC